MESRQRRWMRAAISAMAIAAPWGCGGGGDVSMSGLGLDASMMARLDMAVAPARDLSMAVKPDDLSMTVSPDLSRADLSAPPGSDLSFTPDLAPRPADLAGSADLTSHPSDLAGQGITWVKVGTLNRWPRTDTTDRVAIGNTIYGPVSGSMGGLQWDMTFASQSFPNFTWAQDVSIRSQGCSCAVGTHSYVLGGGGDGVSAPWTELTYLDADYVHLTVSSVAAPFSSHDLACAGDGTYCYAIGGVTSQGDNTGSTAVRIFNPGSATFSAGPPLPTPNAMAAAAVGDGQLLVAGGFCANGGPCPAPNDPSGQPIAVLTTVYSSPLLNPTWSVQPALPRPITGAGMLYLGGRFYLVGGSASASGSVNQSGVLSLALGDLAWQSWGMLPGTGPSVGVYTDGKAILIVVAETDFTYSLYRGTL